MGFPPRQSLQRYRLRESVYDGLKRYAREPSGIWRFYSGTALSPRRVIGNGLQSLLVRECGDCDSALVSINIPAFPLVFWTYACFWTFCHISACPFDLFAFWTVNLVFTRACLTTRSLLSRCWARYFHFKCTYLSDNNHCWNLLLTSINFSLNLPTYLYVICVSLGCWQFLWSFIKDNTLGHTVMASVRVTTALMKVWLSQQWMKTVILMYFWVMFWSSEPSQVHSLPLSQFGPDNKQYYH